MAPALGGVYNLLKEILEKSFGEEMGGVRGTQTPLLEIIAYESQSS